MKTHPLHGFRNQHQSEALPGTLPVGQNSPQQAPHGLYAEQLSGSAFTCPRHYNLRSWLYRIHPSVVQGIPQPYTRHVLWSADDFHYALPPVAMRWSPLNDKKDKKMNLIDGLVPVGMTGSLSDPAAAAYLYQIQQTSKDLFYCNADAEWLWIPQEGELTFHTEFGELSVKPGEIILIPRGVKFSLQLTSSQARGYLCENYKTPFMLPELGPIGANGLANARDFVAPSAKYEDVSGQFQLMTKYQQHVWITELKHSPLDVVAWHGNYVPYHYDLKNFNTIGSVSFDHPDPSIFTVLTSQSNTPGVANLDFVIFPERWMVAEHTFRPPYFHRNVMSELMGLIYGQYDAKETGFEPGGLSLHNCMTPHGPDADAVNKASHQDLKPQYYRGTLAFMLETRQVWHVAQDWFNHPARQMHYPACWQTLTRQWC